MKNYTLNVKGCCQLHQEIAYVADLYRANYIITKADIEYLKELPAFTVLLIKTTKSRKLEICPPREIRSQQLSDEAADFLYELGVKLVISDDESMMNKHFFSVVAPTCLHGIEPGYYSCSCDENSCMLSDVPPGTLPIGVRRDGSLYSRIQWGSTTTSNPYFWICNLIDDDIERNGGTWGANTHGPANAILDFFGEEKNISCIRIFHNVGSPISIEEEMASAIRLYVSNDEKCSHFGNDKADINSVDWTEIVSVQMEMKEQWNTYFLKTPVTAKYVRIELVKNFDAPPDVPWTETAELKIFPVR
ncbi:MAG: discoidin domain-containing protein [Eubacteriales bacterium]|nr:discoidin domain-containing protein [Eubacteriales bacterium]